MKTITQQTINNVLTTAYNEPSSREREPFTTLSAVLSAYDVTYDGSVTITNRETGTIYNIDPGLLVIDAVLAVQHPSAEKREAFISKFPRGIARNLYWASMATAPDKDAPGAVKSIKATTLGDISAEQYRTGKLQTLSSIKLLEKLELITKLSKAAEIKEQLAALQDEIFSPTDRKVYETKLNSEKILSDLSEKYGFIFGRSAITINENNIITYVGHVSKDTFAERQVTIVSELLLLGLTALDDGFEVTFQLKS